MLSTILSVFCKRWPLHIQATLVISYYKCVDIKGTAPGVGQGKELSLLVENGVHPNPITHGLVQMAHDPLHILILHTTNYICCSSSWLVLNNWKLTYILFSAILLVMVAHLGFTGEALVMSLLSCDILEWLDVCIFE